MTVYLAPTFGVGFQAFTSGGLPLNAGLLYTYIAGGTTPQASYTTSAGNVQNANPIMLSADGRPPSEVWLSSSAYRFDLKDADGNLIKTYDNVSGIVSNATGMDTLTVETLTVTGTQAVDKNNADDAVTLVTPDSTDVLYDTLPLSAIFVDGPTAPTTRNFLCGIYIITNGQTIDKGRGLLVNNLGLSDGICVVTQGTGAGTGIASLVQTTAIGATAVVVGTTRSDQYGLVVRQEVAITPTAASQSLLVVEANGAVTEMMRFNSTVASQVGMVFRTTGAGSALISGIDGVAHQYFTLNNTGSIASDGTLSFTGIGDNFFQGLVKYGSNAVSANNGQTVTYNTNVGPGSASLSVQSWLKVRDNSGNLRYMPLFG